jgi:hypothetical protein
MFTNISLQALKALHEIQTELGLQLLPPKVADPPLNDSLAQIGSLSQNSLMLGLEGAGQAVQLDLSDPETGPILLTADRVCGKTLFLQRLARSTAYFFPPEEIGLVILTRSPREWQELEPPPHLLGLYPAYDPAAIDMLYDLACRAEAGTTDRTILLLFDGLDFAQHMHPAGQENLRYLFAYGPRARIWPLASINALRAVKMPDWLSFFRMRIYGHITQPEVADELTALPGAELDTLLPAAQFCLRQNSNWLKFWLPG